jgi:Uma2 family endonuclease
MIPSRVSAAAFEEIAALPENTDRRLELIDGEIIDVVSNSYSSVVAARILMEIGMVAKTHRLGRVTGADGGYVIGMHYYIPDVAFTRFERQPEPSHAAYNPVAPDLAVEVLSPGNETAQMRVKVVNYLNAGTAVWVVDPETKRVEVYAPGANPQVLGLEDTLDGGDALPGFTLPVAEVFPETMVS